MVVLTWIGRVWLKAIDNVLITLKYHNYLACLNGPEKDVSTVATTDNVVISPESSFLYLP